MLTLDPPPEIITFDCYGTLVQWHRAMETAAAAILAARAGTDAGRGRATALAERIRAIAVTHQQRPPFRDYASVLRASLDEALAEIGGTAGADDHETLLATLRRIEPHPEVPAVLARLRTRYRLAIISNTDDHLIAGTVAALGAPVDFVVTAQ